MTKWAKILIAGIFCTCNMSLKVLVKKETTCIVTSQFCK